MKKVFFAMFVALLSAGFVSAQDLESVTNLYNAGAEALNANDDAKAIENFTKALEGAAVLGEEGMELAGKCKDILPKVCLSQGKGFANAGAIDDAIAAFKKASDLATEYGNNADVIDEVQKLVPQMLMANAGTLLNDKKYAEAAAAYKGVVEADPENGVAYLRLGMAYNAAGNVDEAIAALGKAVEFGQEANAKKQLANIYLKKSQACQKEKDFKGALEAAQLSAENANSANAQKLIGLNALNLKQNKIAAEAFESYLAMSPNAKDKNEMIYRLATALQAAGDNAKACGYYKEIAQDPKLGEAARYQMTTLKCQ